MNTPSLVGSLVLEITVVILLNILLRHIAVKVYKKYGGQTRQITMVCIGFQVPLQVIVAFMLLSHWIWWNNILSKYPAYPQIEASNFVILLTIYFLVVITVTSIANAFIKHK